MYDTIIEAEARYLIHDRTERSRQPKPVDVRRRHKRPRRPSWL
jgi:hypothetical protein